VATSLRQKHGNNAHLALEDVQDYITQIATILQDMHDAGVSHGNITPESILIKPDQSIMLADARPPLIIRRFRSTYHPTIYMAPETVPTAASDQYALGILAYEWLTGNPPTPDALESMEMARHHTYILPSPLREQYRSLSKDAEKAIVTALAREPQNRFGSILQFANALEKG
jgi:eukaryotic-like serine/threonine-protein kinase